MSKSTATELQHEPHTAASASRFVEVAVPLHVAQTFTYRLTPELSLDAKPGARIKVPFGRKLITAYIVALHDTLPPDTGLAEADIKDAASLVDLEPVCTPEILQLARWVADYYASPIGEVIKATLPPGINPPPQGSFVRAKLRRFVRLLATDSEPKKTTDKQQRVLDVLAQNASAQNKSMPSVQSGSMSSAHHGSMALQALLKEAAVGAATVSSLEKKGLVEIFDEAVRRDPLAHTSSLAIEEYTLTSAQAAVLEAINKQVDEETYGAFLLHGVTGSGKTEIYIRAMRAALARRRSAMMLVPEIALTPVFSRRLRSHFGDQVAIFHSSLQRGERFDEWTRVRNGDARVVIGTRSAVFAPVQNLGLIVVDEEHESTYRQQESPYYNARDTAIVRAQKESATVVLGSATPSLESFHNARTGKYQLLTLPERIAARPMAPARIVDMRAVFVRHSKPRVFSDELLDAIQATHDRGEQSIILLNRRGYSSFIMCRSCGETVQCPNCDVTLTYHRSERVIICHYCNHRQAVPKLCPSCGKKYIYYVGEGTEQIEEMLTQLFPALRVARIDRDTTARRRVFEQSLADFSAGKIDTLVGTQMLAKGHDFPNVTLVGVVSVDAGLALPDFRSAERTFQLITQVAGRAGRGDRPGQVLIQTYHPYHYALRHACAQDYEGFYNEEIHYRQNHSYPPFVALGSVLVHGPDLGRVRNDSLEVRKQLDAANEQRRCRILGPAPAPLARLKGEHRFQLLLKSRSRRHLREVADAALKAASENGVNLRSVNLEIDPVSIM